MHNLPGFTAQTSLTQADRYYSDRVVELSVEQGVVPQDYVVSTCSGCVCQDDWYDDFGDYLYSESYYRCWENLFFVVQSKRAIWVVATNL